MGFRARLTLAICLLIAAVTGFFAFYMPQQQENAADEGLQVRALNQSRVLSNLVAPSIEFEALDEVNNQLQLVKDDQAFLYAVAYTPDGRVIGQFGRDGVSIPAEGYRISEEVTVSSSGGLMRASAPLRSGDGKAIGGLTLVMSRSSVEAARSNSQRDALIVSLVILVVAVGVARVITRPLVGTAHQLADVSETLIAAARDQETSAAQEGAAVEETRLSMETLLKSAQEIADRSSEVLGNAERSMARNREIADKIGQLGSMLESIMQIADKTDLLALNAALEGTRAGEAGKGFALVAAEMRRLAESVLATATEIRGLMKEMHDASEQAVGASREGTVSSEKIALLTQRQKQATEAVIISMDEMTNVLAQTLAGIQRSTQSANTLADLAGVLTGMIGSKRDDGGDHSGGPSTPSDTPAAVAG